MLYTPRAFCVILVNRPLQLFKKLSWGLVFLSWEYKAHSASHDEKTHSLCSFLKAQQQSEAACVCVCVCPWLAYGYYFFASLGIQIVAIKKSITTFQMVQFLCFIGQSVYLLFVKDCYTPRMSPWMLLVQCAIFFTLFFHFYLTAYGKNPKGSKDAIAASNKPKRVKKVD